MLYYIDKAANSSKFYEMAVERGGGSFVLRKRWGRLTDSGSTGRVDSMDVPFLDERSAQMEMAKTKLEKMRKGYKEAIGRTYPIGLGGAGFGWGGQKACRYVPELRALRNTALASARDMKLMGGAVTELANKESSMAPKLKALHMDAVEKAQALFDYLDQQLSEC